MDFGGVRRNSLTVAQLLRISTLLEWGVYLLTRPCLSRGDCAAADRHRCTVDVPGVSRKVKAVLVRTPPKILFTEHAGFHQVKLRSGDI